MAVTVETDVTEVPAPLRRYHVELRGPRELLFSYPPSKVNGGEILAALAQSGIIVREVSTKEAELEEIFLSLTRPGPAEAAQ